VDRGSTEIVLREGMRYCEERRFSFEEFTVRVDLLVLDGEDRRHVIVADLVEADRLLVPNIAVLFLLCSTPTRCD
jgi:hypothetical protein